MSPGEIYRQKALCSQLLWALVLGLTSACLVAWVLGNPITGGHWQAVTACLIVLAIEAAKLGSEGML